MRNFIPKDTPTTRQLLNEQLDKLDKHSKWGAVTQTEADHRIEVDADILESLRKGHKQTLVVPVILQVQKGDTISIYQDGSRYIFNVLHVGYSGSLPSVVSKYR